MFAILIAEEPPKPHIHNFQTLKKKKSNFWNSILEQWYEIVCVCVCVYVYKIKILKKKE